MSWRACIVSGLVVVMLGACGEREDAPATVPAPPASAPPVPAAPSTAAPATVALDERPAVLSNAGTWSVAWRSQPEAIVPGEVAQLDVQIRRSGAGEGPGGPLELVVDARMPQVEQGLEALPLVRSLGEGRFEVSGLRLSAAGYWEIYFDITAGGNVERAQVSLMVRSP